MPTYGENRSSAWRGRQSLQNGLQQETTELVGAGGPSVLTIGVGAMSEELSKESDRPVIERLEMPLPSELSTVFLGGLFLLALLAALYVAREIILPVVLAFILHLLLAPALRMLERLRAPRMLATVLLIGLLFGTACRARSRDARRSRTIAAGATGSSGRPHR